MILPGSVVGFILDLDGVGKAEVVVDDFGADEEDWNSHEDVLNREKRQHEDILTLECLPLSLVGLQGPRVTVVPVHAGFRKGHGVKDVEELLHLWQLAVQEIVLKNVNDFNASPESFSESKFLNQSDKEDVDDDTNEEADSIPLEGYTCVRCIRF